LGEISFRGREHVISRGLAGLPVAVRPAQEDHRWDVFFCQQRVAQLDLRAAAVE
jgi:hypothetical protein